MDRARTLVILAATAAFCGLTSPAPGQLEWVEKQCPKHRGPVAYDSVRRRIVMFGGVDGGTGETWEWDGVRWASRGAASGQPVQRTRSALTHDARRGVVVMFGGFQRTSGLLGDTWEWDGAVWTQVQPAGGSPSPREWHGLCFDAERGVTVLHGGRDQSGDRDDTWLWDGTSWTQVFPATSPGKRQRHGLAFDAARQRVVLFGGRSFPTHFDDTWEWDGSDWILVQPAGGGTAPAARREHGMAYDVARQRTLLYGGLRPGFGENMTDLWAWDGATWTQLQPTRSPMPNAGQFVAHDAARDRTVLVNTAMHGASTWEWDGTDWAPRGYGCTNFRGAAYDTDRQVVVGLGGAYEADETWEWDGIGWTHRPTLNHPGIRSGTCMTYDRARKVSIVYGGSPAYGDTWLYDGNDWTQVFPATSPGVKTRPTMEYDTARQIVVMFGGDFTDETWEWDGVDWTLRNLPQSPVGRAAHAMAYDERRQVMVIYGGCDPAGGLDDTWEYDGITWTQRFPATVPPTRRYHSMSYDSTRDRVVMHAGQALGQGIFDDTWEWDGADWCQVSLTGTNPPLDPSDVMVYDAARQRMVYREWVFGTTVDGRVSSFGLGCAGARGVPRLEAWGEPVFGNPSFTLDVTSALPRSGGLMMLSDTPANIKVLGCRLHVDPAALLTFPISCRRTGYASMHLPVPADPALMNRSLFAQALILDDAAPGGVTLTNGLQMVVGD